MKQVCFLIPDLDMKPGSLFNAIEIFERANEFLFSKKEGACYDIRIVGKNITSGLLNTQFSIASVDDVASLPSPDLIIITGIHQPEGDYKEKNRELLDWMVKKYKDGTELVSLCTGTFFLAATGLLKNSECASHWKTANAFMEQFPDVKLRTDKIITYSKGIYTSGGGHSSLNLILYLVEKYSGRPAALYCAKVLQIDIERNSQSPFILFEGQKDHGDDGIREVQEFIEKNLDERVTVDLLAGKFAISRRSLVRRFRKATNNAPIEYIQRVKMEAAKRSLELSRKNVNEVMYSVGYTDTKAFRTIFKKVTGLSPVDYRNKYNREFY